jgi:hypothetical protein
MTLASAGSAGCSVARSSPPLLIKIAAVTPPPINAKTARIAVMISPVRFFFGGCWNGYGC